MKMKQRVAPKEATPEQLAPKASSKNSYRWLDVRKDFGGQIGAPSCGDKAPKPRPNTEKARAIRKVYCDAARARIFTSMLSPNYDRPHHDHFHLELTPKVKWRIVR